MVTQLLEAGIYMHIVVLVNKSTYAHNTKLLHLPCRQPAMDSCDTEKLIVHRRSHNRAGSSTKRHQQDGSRDQKSIGGQSTTTPAIAAVTHQGDVFLSLRNHIQTWSRGEQGRDLFSSLGQTLTLAVDFSICELRSNYSFLL